MPPRKSSRLPEGFRDNIRKLRSQHVPKMETEDYMVQEITEEVLGSPDAIRTSLLTSHITAIDEVMREQRGFDNVLDSVRERLEELKTQLQT